jgi:hypothetical protein
MRGRLCRWARFWERVLAYFWRALRGAGGRWRWGLGFSGGFVLLGRRVEWPPRRVDGLALRHGFVGVGVVGEVRRWVDGVGLAATFGVGLVSGVFGAGGRWFSW